MVLVFLEIWRPTIPGTSSFSRRFFPLSPAVSPWILPTLAFTFYDVIGSADPTAIPLRISKVTVYLLTCIAIVFDIRSGRLPGFIGRRAHPQ